MAADSTCAACDAPIDEAARECPECGNNPFRDAVRGLAGAGLALGAASIFVPPLVYVGVVLVLSAVVLFGLDRAGLDYWGTWYSPAKRDWAVFR